eukprot:scaffold24257_cov113-Cylindrotheca_fusiformis.AAC.1
MPITALDFLFFSILWNLVSGFVLPPEISREKSLTMLSIVRISGYEAAIETIDRCSTSKRPTDNLYDAVRFIDKNGLKIYPTIEDKQELWETAYGSWQLQLATGGGKYRTFKPVPIFAFAMLDETNFGNGIGWNQDGIILSLLGPHVLNTKQRRMFITIDDIFLGGSKVSDFAPGFLKESMGLGKKPADFKKPPAFTFIGASDKSLIARGGTGGIAIWTRLEKDIRPAAYGAVAAYKDQSQGIGLGNVGLEKNSFIVIAVAALGVLTSRQGWIIRNRGRDSV